MRAKARAATAPREPTTQVELRRPTVDLDRWRNDFEGFAALLDVITESGEMVKLRPRPIPALFEAKRTGRDIILKPRQIGMTVWELARDVWFFLTRPGAHVVVVCQSMADDGAIREISDKLRVMFEALRDELGLAFPVQPRGGTAWFIPSRNATLRVVGAGASEAAAKKKGRSGQIHRLHITELAFFEYAKATLTAILACVPAPEFGSEVVIESTPNGAAGAFYEWYQAAKLGNGGYTAHFYPWFRHTIYRTPLAANDNGLRPETPRERELVEKYGVSLEQLKWYRTKVQLNGQDLTDQEYPLDEETCWLIEGRTFFDRERTQALLVSARDPVDARAVGESGSHGFIRTWKKRQDGRRYVIAVDPSEGVGNDPGAAVVLDRGSGEHVASLHGQFATWEMARLTAALGKEYWGIRGDGARDPALIVVERNNHGHAVLQALVREHRYPCIYAGADKRAGWVNSEPSRAAALAALQSAHKGKHWASPEKETLSEMLKFIVLANGRAEAAKGAHDDLILAHAIGWDVVCRPAIERYVPPGLVA